MTEEIFNSGNVSVNVLQIRKGGYCSEHQHAKKSNLFHVISGALEVCLWPEGPGGHPDTIVLEAGMRTFIPSGVWHKFRALADTACVEIYDVRLAGEDIVRRTKGGIDA